jgi:hypothetical protein
VQTRFLVMCVLAGILSACSAPSTTPPATPAIAMAAPAPGPEAKTCLWFFASSGSGQEFTAAPSSIAMSADGWCWAKTRFSHHNLSFAPTMDIVTPPEHGTVAFQSGPNGLVEVGYRPDGTFSGTDHATVVAKQGFFQAIYPFVMNVARPDGVFAAEPPPHGLPRGTTILVDDGTCPAGQIKHVTAGTPRKKVCMPATG